MSAYSSISNASSYYSGAISQTCEICIWIWLRAAQIDQSQIKYTDGCETGGNSNKDLIFEYDF